MNEIFLRDTSRTCRQSLPFLEKLPPEKRSQKGPPPGGALFGPFSGFPGTAALRFSPISPTCSIAKVLGGGPRDPPGI